jgi:prepilin peptidase CpaA
LSPRFLVSFSGPSARKIQKSFREIDVGTPYSVTVPIAIVLVGSLIAAATDILKFKVYNALTFPLLTGGLLFHAYLGGWHGLGDSTLGLLFGFGALIVLHVLGGVGAGDVKLMAAIGAWLGVEKTFYVFIASALATGVYASVLVLTSGRLAEHATNLQILIHRLSSIGKYLGADDRMEAEINSPERRRRVVPFAAMVAVGFIVTIVYLKHR